MVPFFCISYCLGAAIKYLTKKQLGEEMVHFTLKFVWGRYGGHSILSVVAGSLGSWSYCIARKQGKIFDAGTQVTSSFFFLFSSV